MNPTPWPPSSVDPPLGDKDCPTLFQTALEWLREDREYRRELEKAGRKTRGARRGQVRILLAAVAINWGARLTERARVLGCAIEFRIVL